MASPCITLIATAPVNLYPPCPVPLIVPLGGLDLKTCIRMGYQKCTNHAKCKESWRYPTVKQLGRVTR